MNDGEKPSRRSSGMYFLKVGNQVASEGEEKKKARPLGSWEEKSEATGGSWEERSEAIGGVGKKKARPLGEKGV